MARNLGEARVSILPDGTRFKPETEAAIKKGMAGVQAKVKLDADSEGLRTQVKAATEGLSAKVKLDADSKDLDAQIAALKAKTDALSKSLGNVKISDPNAQSFLKGLTKQADELKSSIDKIGDSKGLSAASGQLDRMISASDQVRSALGKTTFSQEQVGDAAKAAADKVTKAAADEQASIERIAKAREADVLDQERSIGDLRSMYSKMFDDLNKRDKVKVNLDGSLAETEGISLRERLKAILDNIKAKFSVDKESMAETEAKGAALRDALKKQGNDGGKGFGSSFIGGLGRSALMQNPGITAAVIAGLAALPAAVGAVGVLGGLALGAGLVIGAEKLISTQVKTLTAQVKTQMTGMGKPATPKSLATQQLAITSTQNTVTQLENTKKLTAAQATQLANAKARLAVEKQNLAVSQQQGKGTAAQQAALTQSQQQLAVYQKDLAAFSKLNNAVKNLKLAFLDFAIVASKPLIKPFTDAIDELSKQLRGPLGSEFVALFKAVGPFAKVVLNSLLEIVKGVLPGMTDMLNKARGPLTTLFLGFGKIVGLKVGQWFRDAIPFIKDSGTYLNKLIGFLGNAGSWLIKFGGATAKAFAGSQFKGFGKLVSDLANDLTKIVIPAFEGWATVTAPVVRAIARIVIPILNFLAANPALVKAIGMFAAAWYLVSKALVAVRIAMAAFDVVMALADVVMDANLVGLLAIGFEALAVIVAIVVAAMVVAVIEIVQHWSGIATFFTYLWKHIWSGFIGPMINFFTNTIPHAFGVSLNWIEKNWGRIVQIVGGPLSEVVTFVTHNSKQIYSAIVGAWGHIENVVTGIVKPIASVITGAWNQIYRITKTVWNVIYLAIRLPALIILGLVGELVIGVRNLFNKVWPYLYSFTKTIWGHIENAITGVVKPIVSVVAGAWDNVKSITSSVWNWLFGATKSIWGRVENTITGIVKPIVSVVAGAWDTVKHWTEVGWNDVFTLTKNLWGEIENFITGIVKPIVNNIRSAWSNIKNWTNDAFNYVHDHIINPLSKAYDWINGVFVKNVKSAFHDLVGAVGAIWNGLKAIVANPINFVIQHVWNPFAGFVNKGLSIFGIKDKLPSGAAIHLAGGGHVPGYAPGSDTVPAMLSPGEYVLNPTAAKAIGIRNLDGINAAARPGGGQHMVKNAIGHFAGGGLQGDQQILADAERYKGHKYVWGGPSNPQKGWDCSSFVGYVLGHDFGRALPGGVRWNPNAHGPVASQYNRTPGFNLVSHRTADIQPGDLLVENSGGHVGFGAGPNKMFSAFGTNSGTLLTNAANMTNIYRNTGPLSSNGPLSIIGSILTQAAQAALSGISALATVGLGKVPGTGPMHDLPIAAVKDVISGAEGNLNNNPANFTQAGGGGGIPGGNPPGGTTAGDYANAVEGYKYFKQYLFGGNQVAAAGAVASIDGESTWNPFSVGTGGRGLIGWTPPSSISDAAFKGGMKTQLPAILQYLRANGDGGAISAMTHAGSVNSAAQIWDSKVERAGKNDVHPYGLNLASGIMKQYKASGGTIRPAAKPALTAAEKLAAVKKAVAAAAAKADAARVSKLELKPLATLKALASHFTAKMAKDTRTGNYNDYFGSSLALNDVDKAIAGWISPLQREHDTDARGYRKYAALAARDKAAGNKKAFFKDQVQANKYAAAIAKIDPKLAAQAAASASTFVPLNIPVNNSYMSGFGQFGGQFKLGGMLPAGPGFGVAGGVPFSFNENGNREKIVPAHVQTPGPPHMTSSQAERLIAAVERNTQVTAAGQQQTNKALGGVGRGIL